jgi:hypothetical protein
VKTVGLPVRDIERGSAKASFAVVDSEISSDPVGSYPRWRLACYFPNSMIDDSVFWVAQHCVTEDLAIARSDLSGVCDDTKDSSRVEAVNIRRSYLRRLCYYSKTVFL